MKKVLLLVVCVALATVGYAKKHQERTPEQQASAMTTKMTKALDLTSDQQAKVATLNLDLAKQRAEAKAKKATITPEQRKAAVKEYRTSLQAILTPDQYNKFVAEAKARKKKHHDEKK